MKISLITQFYKNAQLKAGERKLLAKETGWTLLISLSFHYFFDLSSNDWPLRLICLIVCAGATLRLIYGLLNRAFPVAVAIVSEEKRPNIPYRAATVAGFGLLGLLGLLGILILSLIVPLMYIIVYPINFETLQKVQEIFETTMNKTNADPLMFILKILENFQILSENTPKWALLVIPLSIMIAFSVLLLCALVIFVIGHASILILFYGLLVALLVPILSLLPEEIWSNRQDSSPWLFGSGVIFLSTFIIYTVIYIVEIDPYIKKAFPTSLLPSKYSPLIVSISPFSCIIFPFITSFVVPRLLSICSTLSNKLTYQASHSHN